MIGDEQTASAPAEAPSQSRARKYVVNGKEYDEAQVREIGTKALQDRQQALDGLKGALNSRGVYTLPK